MAFRQFWVSGLSFSMVVVRFWMPDLVCFRVTVHGGASDLSFSMLSWCFSFGGIVLGLFHFRVFFSAEFFFFAGNVSLLCLLRMADTALIVSASCP